MLRRACGCLHVKCIFPLYLCVGTCCLGRPYYTQGERCRRATNRSTCTEDMEPNIRCSSSKVLGLACAGLQHVDSGDNSNTKHLTDSSGRGRHGHRATGQIRMGPYLGWHGIRGRVLCHEGEVTRLGRGCHRAPPCCLFPCCSGLTEYASASRSSPVRYRVVRPLHGRWQAGQPAPRPAITFLLLLAEYAVGHPGPHNSPRPGGNADLTRRRRHASVTGTRCF